MPPPDVPGAGSEAIKSGYQNWLTIDRRQQTIVSSLAAMRGRVTAAAGYMPPAAAPVPELTIPLIANTHSYTDRVGWCDRKADLDFRCLRDDGHLQSVDRIRRSAAFDALRRVHPCNGTPLAILVANATRAVLDDIDGFVGSLGELGVANGAGFAMQEIVWRPKRLRIVVDKNRAVTVPSECVASLEPVHNRHIAFEMVSDAPRIRMDMGWIDPARSIDGSPLRKFLFHKGYGDGPARQRGYMYAGHYLTYLTGLSVERLSIVVEQYGVSTPYLLMPEVDIPQEEQDNALGILQDMGKGIPGLIRESWGEVKQTQTPSGLVPIHQYVIGYLDAMKSKLVISNVLSVDVSGTGSYNASSTHQDQLLATQRIDLKLKAETLRTQLLRYIVDVNARAWAFAFSPYVPGGCTPDDVKACCPVLALDLIDPIARLKMFVDAKDAGWNIDEDQVREECSFRAAAQFAPETPTPASPGPPLTQVRTLPPVEEIAPIQPESYAVLLPLPLDVAEQFVIPGFEPAASLHITLATLRGPAPDSAAAISVELAQLFENAPQLSGVIGRTSGTFDLDGGGVAHWASVDVEGLDELREAVIAVLQRYGEVADEDFIPHVALAFSYGAEVVINTAPVIYSAHEAALSLSPDSASSDWVRFTFSSPPTSQD